MACGFRCFPVLKRRPAAICPVLWLWTRTKSWNRNWSAASPIAETKITLVGVADRPGVAAGLFGPLADAAVNVDMIVQNVSEDGARTDLTFTVSKGDLDRARSVIEAAQGDLQYRRLLADSNVVKVSVIGVGMRSHAGVAQRMFKSLADKGINIQV